ncbi:MULTISPECIES: GNAT family N-acetyltransferase [Nocardiopsis]|uniref:GNAT family N-acetyltransferase n=1 Tax=Nocardiopsis sinuspersici TaxID=501010 RepID=A0A1V3BWD6_9ACTN|nr:MULTISPECIES: GNAT family N-acetyltransferase [Nocardiopsis]NYH54109.1 ribosomal protein S18 acetylase RimI-like enzyme [Nocardiopsis sinuspersici]OOC52944.1 GNAT family N-acetyltransferase [Nocardiopsis sinuspersici]
MSSAQFVRPARASDVDTVVDVQVASWRAVYGALLPEDVADALGGEEAREQFREQWTAALQSPPTSRHRLVVSTDEVGGVRTVTGFAAFGPAGDPDVWPATDAEVFALHVDPDRARQGHGSRLVNACVDHLVDDGFTTVHVWVPEADNALRAFFEASGWRPDGARREIDMGRLLPMVRLHAAISR